LLGIAGASGAQTAPPQTPEKPAVELGAAGDVLLTPPEMQNQARESLREMDREAQVVRHQLADARARHDVVRVLCLNDKLNQIDLATRTATDRTDTLNAAASQTDTDRTKHEFTVVQVLRERVKSLVSEAHQCIGEEVGFTGDSRVTLTVGSAGPAGDPSEFPADPLVAQVPQLSSPTL
jgi:hypothetical protein